MSELIPLPDVSRSFLWTALPSDSSEMTSEDPLGLGYVAQQMGLMILPTLTTRSTRAQAYAMVLYGLALAKRATVDYGYVSTDEKKRELFERWERFWALASLEFRGGDLPRGDWDTMRGIRGAKAAWRSGDGLLNLDFPMISRQQELGNLGAYLVPLRRARLVIDGGVTPTPAAMDIIESFWDEAGENKQLKRYEDYALRALDPGVRKIERLSGSLTLKQVGKRSRLSSLANLRRVEQQRRLYELLFVHAPDATTHAMASVVQSAAESGVTDSREVLTNALAGDYGALDTNLRELLLTTRALGDYVGELVLAFDRAYATLFERGFVVPRADVAAGAFSTESLAQLQSAAAVLLDAPRASAIRSLPVHGHACLRLAADLQGKNANDALERILTYHSIVQKERRRGSGWIQDDGAVLTLMLATYRTQTEIAFFPSFKLDVVRTLLTDLGRLPFEDASELPEVGA